MSFRAVGPTASPVKVEPAQTHLLSQWKHTAPLVGCRFDPSGKYVFAGGQEAALQRWELAGGKKTTLEGHKSWVRALAFATKEKLLFAAGQDGKLLTWPLEDETPTPVRTWALVARYGGFFV